MKDGFKDFGLSDFFGRGELPLLSGVWAGLGLNLRSKLRG